MDPLIVLFGLGVGILIGLTGIGGGSLMTPLLLLVGGYSPVVAIGTDLTGQPCLCHKNICSK
jgi:uncharacterized membrane protein YfcA